MHLRKAFWLSLALLALLGASGPAPAQAATFPEMWWPLPEDEAAASRPADRFIIAVIGDYGYCGYSCGNQQAVANLVHSWQPDVIVTTGDNSYENGLSWEVEANQKPYAADVQAGRFFPAHGNHDWGNQCSDPAGIQPSLEYFGVPIYYVAHLGHGLIDLIVTDTTCSRTNVRTGAEPPQAADYNATVAASTALWKITVGHHPPFSSGQWGSHEDRHWLLHPQVDLYLSGHNHDNEHLVVGGQHFVVTGVGGKNVYPMNDPIAGSVWGYWKDFGAVRLTVGVDTLTVEYINVNNEVLHTFTLGREKSLGTYATEIRSYRPPWHQTPVATAGLEVILRRAGSNYIGKLGNTGRTIAIPAAVVAQEHGLFVLSVFLKSSVVARRPPEQLIAFLPADLAHIDSVAKQTIVELYATLLDMQQSGQFGSIWADQIARAQIAGGLPVQH